MTVTDTTSSILGYRKKMKKQLCVTKEALFPTQIYWIRSDEISSADKLSRKSIPGSWPFLDILNSAKRSGDTKQMESNRNKWKEEYSRSTCKYGKNNVKSHLYEFNKYVPDFENGCYMLQFQCEYCGDEVYDIVNDEYKGNYEGWKQTETSEVAARYSKKQPNLPVVCIQRIKLREEGLFIPSIKIKEVRI
jgi:hypothetical protein